MCDCQDYCYWCHPEMCELPKLNLSEAPKGMVMKNYEYKTIEIIHNALAELTAAGIQDKFLEIKILFSIEDYLMDRTARAFSHNTVAIWNIQQKIDEP